MGTELMNLVAFHDKDLITTSSIVARVFGMRHDNVLQAIESLKEGVEGASPPEFSGGDLIKSGRLEHAPEDGYKRKSAFIPSDKGEEHGNKPATCHTSRPRHDHEQ